MRILEHKKDSNKTNGTITVDEFLLLQEKGYLASSLNFHIQKNAVHKRKNSGSLGWSKEPDRDTNLKHLLLQHLVKYYSLKAVYAIFYKDQDLTNMDALWIKEAKQCAYYNIDVEDSFSWEEKELLRRRVMGMSPIQFGLIVEFVWESGLFWDAENKEEVYPDIR